MATTRIPAAIPAATPVLASSMTQHSRGATFSSAAARRKMSGAGLVDRLEADCAREAECLRSFQSVVAVLEKPKMRTVRTKHEINC